MLCLYKNAKICLNDKLLQFVVALIGSFSSLFADIIVGWMAPINQELLNGDMGFTIDKDQLGWIGSLMSLGAAIFTIFTGSICEFFGRKTTMLLLIIPNTIGWCLIIWADKVIMLYIGRFLTGMAAGSYSVLSTLYISETAQKEWSGILGGLTSFMMNIGCTYSSIISLFCVKLRNYNILCGAIPLMLGILLIFIPETPPHLLRKGRTEQARLVLKSLRNVNYNVDNEIIEIKANIDKHIKSTFNLKAFKASTVQKACIVGFGLMIFKKTSGVDIFAQYTTYVFQDAQIHLDAKTQTLILNIILLIGVFQVFIVKKVGHKLLLCLCSIVMTIALIVMGTVFLLKSRNLISTDYFYYLDYMPLLALIFHSIAYSFGLGPVPWILLADLFPQELKGSATSIGIFLYWTVGFAMTKMFMVVDESLGTDVAFFMIALCTFLTFIFVIVFVRDTKSSDVV